MKYIKTFEALITLELDNDDLIKIMKDAMMSNKIGLIRSLLENGFDPNYGNSFPLLLQAAKKGNIELVKLFIEFNANLNCKAFDREPILFYLLKKIIEDNKTLIGAAVALRKMTDILILLIKSGTDITNDFMIELNNIRKRRNIGNSAEELYYRIINECPKEYEKYKVSLESNKFNV